MAGVSSSQNQIMRSALPIGAKLFAVRALTWAREQYWLFPVAIFLFLRIWTSFWAVLSATLFPQPVPIEEGYYGLSPLASRLDRILWWPWVRWDTTWYIKIAAQGYVLSDSSTAFFPLYPFLIKLSAPLLGHNLAAASVIIASLAALAGFILLYKLVLDEQGEQVARRAILYLGVFPTSFFLFAGYTEALFLALVLGAYLCVRKRKWELGCVLGALVALARPEGMLFILPLAVEFLLQYRRKEVSLVRGLNLLTVSAGAVAYPLMLAVQFGNVFAWLQAESAWHRTTLPWDTLSIALNQALSAQDIITTIRSLPDPILALLFIAFTVWSFLRLSLTLAIYMTTIVVLPLFSMTTYLPFLPLASMSRYVLVAFPAFILLARQRWSVWMGPLVAVSLLVQMCWLVAFGAWVFVG